LRQSPAPASSKKTIVIRELSKPLCVSYIKRVPPNAVHFTGVTHYADNREPYHKLYVDITNVDKHIARLYDRMSGSSYPFIIVAQVREGIVAKGELEAFSPEVREWLEQLLSL
jgi:hypothetical protein